VTLGANRYGKSGIRLVKLVRQPEQHELKDLTVSIAFEGDFETAHSAGDNSAVLPTDTMKNTVYALAKQHTLEHIEAFGLALGAHFLEGNPQVSRVVVDIRERMWERLEAAGQPAPSTFLGSRAEARTASVDYSRERVSVRSGLDDLLLLKSSQSAFSGFLRDRYTTLRDTEDRILATALTASWLYRESGGNFTRLWGEVRQALLDAFAAHDSRSVQHTLYAMGEAVLERCREVEEIRLTMPNKHHLPVDLAPFGLPNDNDVFVATEAPFGLIEATVIREHRV
jgi:urate oxidase